MGAENNLIWSGSQELNKPIKGGSLLLAEPFMPDDYFKKSVVLVCEHNENNGTTGFVLNQLSDARFNGELFKNISSKKIKIYYGGPVEKERLFFVHSLGDYVEQTEQISDKLYWNGNIHQIFELYDEGIAHEENTRFFIGCSGWSPGQLNDEIKDSSWIINNKYHKEIFSYSIDTIWKDILNEMDLSYQLLANYPEHAALN